MASVIVTVVSQQQKFPQGTVSAGIKISLSNGTSQTVTASPYAATFTDVSVGTYTITAEAVDASGAVLGASVTGTVTIEMPETASTSEASVEVTIDVPASLTVSVL